MNPKQPKHMHLQRMSLWTKNKVIHRFLITTTHAAPICQGVTLKYKIIQCKNLAMNYHPHKKGYPFRNLYFPSVLLGENGSRSLPNLMVE